MIPPELVHFLESGLSALVGTCDSSLRPTCCRAVGVVVRDGGSRVTVFVPEVVGAKTVADLRENPRLALTLSHPMTHRTIQLKGRVDAVRVAAPEERAVVSRYLEALARSVGTVGMPRGRVAQLTHWPAWALDFTVADLFTQTPGPRAGKPLCPEADREA